MVSEPVCLRQFAGTPAHPAVASDVPGIRSKPVFAERIVSFTIQRQAFLLPQSTPFEVQLQNPRALNNPRTLAQTDLDRYLLLAVVARPLSCIRTSQVLPLGFQYFSRMWSRLFAAALLLAVSHAATTTVQLARRGSNLDPIAARSRMNIAVRQQ